MRTMLSLTVLLAVLMVAALAYGAPPPSIPLEGSPSIGPEDAPLVLIEFLDYQ